MRDVTAQEQTEIKKITTLLKMFGVSCDVAPIYKRKTMFRLIYIFELDGSSKHCTYTFKSVNSLASGAHRLIRQKQQRDGIL